MYIFIYVLTYIIIIVSSSLGAWEREARSELHSCLTSQIEALSDLGALTIRIGLCAVLIL